MQEQKTNTQKVIRGLSSQTLVTIVLGILEIISFSIMSRLLSPKDFGYYAAIVAVSIIFSSLTSHGIGAAVVRRKDLDKEYVDNAFTLSFIIGVLVAITLCSFSGLLARSVADETMQVPLMLYSVTLLLSCITSVNMALMQRQLHFFRIGAINLLSIVLTTIMAVILALQNLGYYAILAKTITGSILTYILSYFVSKAHYSFRFKVEIVKQIFNFSGWLMASSLFRNLANQIDRLLMTSLFSVEILGQYSRPKDLITTITDKVNSIFDTTLFPILSTFQDKESKMVESYRFTLYFMNIIGMLLTSAFFFNSEMIVRVFFGEEWLNINVLFQILSFTPVLYVNGRISDIYLRSLGLTRSQFFFRVGQLSITVLLIFLVYKVGILAVAIAAMVGYCSIVVMKVLYISKHIHISILSSFISITKGWRFVLYIIPFYIFCTASLPHNWVGCSIQAFVYVLILFFLFLIIPLSVGNLYKEFAYPKIISLFKKERLWIQKN